MIMMHFLISNLTFISTLTFTAWDVRYYVSRPQKQYMFACTNTSRHKHMCVRTHACTHTHTHTRLVFTIPAEKLYLPYLVAQ
jgi:hypothetical protein